MLDNAPKWAVYFIVLSAVVLIGWKEPLRYRFMSKSEIASTEKSEAARQAMLAGAGSDMNALPATESAAPAVPQPIPESRTPQLSGSSLERGPYKTSNGHPIYSGKFDNRKLGTATETSERPNTTGL